MLTVIFISIILILCEGFFSGSEIVIVSSNRFNLRIKALQGDRHAQQVLDLLAEPEKLVTSTLVGSNLAIVANTSIVTLYVIKHFGIDDLFWVSLVLTPVMILFGEYLPKSFAKTYCDSLIKFVGPIISFFSWLYTPIIWLMGIYSRLISRLLGLPLYERRQTSKQELESLMALENESVQISPNEKKMIGNLIQLAETKIGEVSKPLIEVEAVALDEPLKACFDLLEEYGYTKFPVYEDRVDNIIGYIDLYSLIDVENFQLPVKKFIQKAAYVPEVMRLDRVIEMMKKRNKDLLIVVDEYGAATGIATLEDILEEVTGEIEDEYDDSSIQPKKVAQNAFVINARMEIDKLNSDLRLHFPEGEYDTLGGFIVNHFGRIPKKWETLRVGKAFMTITKASERSIDEIYLEIDDEGKAKKS